MHLINAFDHFLDIAQQKPENMLNSKYLSKILITEKSTKKLILVHFLLLFLFRQMVKNYASCWATLHIVKVEIQHTNYFLYSNLKS